MLTILLISCSKTDEQNLGICVETLSCPDEHCLFTINSASGEIVFLNCFNKYAIETPSIDYPESNMYLILESWDEDKKGETLKFCGYARENKIPIQFPDPNINEAYEFSFEAFEIQN